MEEKDRRQRSQEEKLLFLKAAEEHGIIVIAPFSHDMLILI
jgi:hypothetical protein